MEELRPLLTTYAYNILGTLEDARDIVQDALLKFSLVDQSKIDDKKAYLVRTVINLSINLKKKQKRMRAAYPGEWLPEPVTTENADAAINSREILSYSLMVLLEKLNAKQRAVFILKEAFDYDHEEIARVLGITTEYSRKLLSRAKDQLHAVVPVRSKSIEPEYLNKYLQVIRSADTGRLEQLLNEDIVLVSDGGGKATAFINPVSGKKSVIALLLGIHKKFYADVRLETGYVNHEPALFFFQEGVLVTCQIFIIQDGIIKDLFFIRNPDKLKELQKTF